MSDTILTILISSVFGLLGSMLVVAVAWKKAPNEARNLDAQSNLANTQASIVLNERLTIRVEKLEIELAETCDALEKEKKERQAESAALRTELRKIRDERDLYEDWSKRLSHQVQMRGEIPVPMKPSYPSAP